VRKKSSVFPFSTFQRFRFFFFPPSRLRAFAGNPKSSPASRHRTSPALHFKSPNESGLWYELGIFSEAKVIKNWIRVNVRAYMNQ
jgi:hypothetical protein